MSRRPAPSPSRAPSPPASRATSAAVAAVRQSSRALVRELGFLQGRLDVLGLPHSYCHALLEIERAGELPQADLPELLRLDKSTTSRITAELGRKRLVRAAAGADRRSRRLSLTRLGARKLEDVHRDANARVAAALEQLPPEERDVVVRGLAAYARGLELARRRARLSVRRAARRDRAQIASLIRDVMPEFGASGPGFAILDPEVSDMPRAYAAPRSAYWVLVERDARGRERVVGGAGFAPLAGADAGTCELRKMYFRPEARGLGFGKELLGLALEGARAQGFSRMYLETLGHMTAARALYEAHGFVALREPLGATGHFGCNAFYARAL